MSIVKPLLASEAPADVRFPVLASAKLDGIRGIVTSAGLQSRSGKLIPNLHVQAEFKKHGATLLGLDGELIVGEPNAKDVFRVTTSAVMTVKFEPNFRYYVFDHVGHATQPFTKRYEVLTALQKSGKLPKWIVVLPQIPVSTKEELAAVEEAVVGEGYEGLIIRSPTAAYKHGRSSAKEGILLKVRRFKDSEAVIVGVTEELENQNVAMRDAFGRTERSSHQDNMVGKGALGALRVIDCVTNKEFQIGTGFDRAEREDLWAKRASLVGKTVKYRYFDVGVKDLPRFPVFQGFRDKRDMS